MDDIVKTGDSPARSWWTSGLVSGLALAVLGGTLAWSALDLRTRIRAQIVQRDAEILDAVTQMQHLNDQTGGETIATLADPGEQFQLALKVSRLRNVLGVRLYSGTGKFVNAFPVYITEAALPAAEFATLQNLAPVSSFLPQARLQEQDMLAESNGAPVALLLVEVPLRTEVSPRLAGVIQFVMEGSGIARQYAQLDRDLTLKFGLAFVVGAAILITGLGVAFLRVRRANQSLAGRTRDLLQANRELALAARTSAVGAVASHLIHGLRNPLSGLRDFVHLHQVESGGGTTPEWQEALGTTQRMEELINRVVRVLQEQQTGVAYEISISEMIGMLAPKALALAAANGVRFETRVRFDGNLSNRESDVILLILENLVQNAIEATPAGKPVKLTVAETDGVIHFEVRDEGPGLPASLATRLFLPCTSGKKGGGGIGLAISKQLAKSLGAQLDLASNSVSGCVFRLALLQPTSEIDPQAVNKRIPSLNEPN